MPGKSPSSKTFPSSVTCTIIPPAAGETANVLILLHSLGDTQKSFAQLAKNLNLPETTCISLCAPRYMPFGLEGYQWGEDVIFEGEGLAIDAKFENAGFKTIVTVVDKLIEDGWRSREIFFLGWGQGAICVFDYLCREGPNWKGMTREFGGVISIGGIIGSEVKTVVKEGENKSATPVLVCGGRKGLVTGKAEERIKSLFKDVETVRWKRDSDGMFQNREEVLPMMKFLSRRLRSRKGVPEGFSELSA